MMSILLIALLQSVEYVESLECTWSSGVGQLVPYITSGNPLTVSAGDVDDCRQKCVKQTAFLCAAINYQSNGMCQLLAENDQTATINTSSGGRYSIRPACAGFWQPWTAVRGRYLQQGVTKESAGDKPDLRECMKECLQDTTGESCRSIIKSVSGGTCERVDKRSDDEGVIPENNQGSQYFNRPSWYLDDSPGATNTSAADRGGRGGAKTAVNLFIDYTIPVDGYLVAWQYYASRNASACESYATIWRHDSQSNTYNRITETKITPDTERVKFQFVQDTTAVVRAGDFIGTYVGSGGCDGHVVGFKNDGPEALLYKGGDATNRPSSISADGLERNSRSVPVRAYVAVFIKLNSVSATHTSSSPGSIRLQWQQPAEYQTGSGYMKIDCSTDSNFQSPVDCQPNTVPIEEEGATLSLSDIRQPYYARVYIVRHYQEQELVQNPDDRYYLVNGGDPFCNDRGVLTDSDVAISEQLSGDKIELTVSVPSIKSDNCVQSVDISYGTGSLSDQDKTQSWVFTKGLGETFRLTIKLLLVDGHRALVWNKDYTTSSNGITDPPSISRTTLTNDQSSPSSRPTASSSPGSEPAGSSAANVPVNTTPGSTAVGPAVGGAVGGVIAVAVAVVVVVLVIQQRRRKAKEDPENAIALMTSNSRPRPVGEVRPTPKHPPTYANAPSSPDGESSRRLTTNSTVVIEPGNTQSLPSRNVLISDLYRIIREEQDTHGEDAFKEEFKKIGQPIMQCQVGRQPENIKKNRFKNITAGDSNRVVLTASAANGYGSDYVNANYIKDYRGQKRFIASQGPNDETLEDLWRLLHDTNSDIIVMLTNPVEATKTKCSVYWPENMNTPAVYGQFEVLLVEELFYAEYTVRTLKYTYQQKSREVHQYHFTQWPDHGVPTTTGLLNFRHRVKQHMAKTRHPVVIHCSAGVGRTGTFIGLDILIDEGHDKAKRPQSTVDLMKCVYEMRLQRTQMIQTYEQYGFLYTILAEALACGDTAVECSKFKQRLSEWRKKVPGKLSVLEEQFRKVQDISATIPEEMYYSGAVQENVRRNRDRQILPLETHRLILSTATHNYINAVYCDSYYTRHGLIVTQTPLENTEHDFWMMVHDGKCAAIVYLNDCQDVPYWPHKKGANKTAGNIHLHCKAVKPHGAPGLTLYTLTCKRGKEERTVSLIELKMTQRTQLPKAEQLVSVCQAAEMHASSGSHPMVVQCMNGNRLSGLMVVALNLYLRARIEQEVDVVLEVKMSRRSRPQFIPNIASFDLLYEFVSTYINDFSLYSNFGQN